MATSMAPSPASRPNRFKPTLIHRFASEAKGSDEKDARFWRALQFPVSVQGSGQVHQVDVAEASPHLVAVTGSAKVQLYDPSSHAVYKTFSKFRERSYGGRLRRDARLLAAGGDDGAVRLFDVESKSQLRSFEGHQGATRRVDFTADNLRLASFSDDQVSCLWDIAANQQVAKFEGHKDYVRAGCCSTLTSSLLVTGSYDHTVRLWDQRKEGGGQVAAVDHGAPVEAVVFMPGEALVASAGGHEVRIWDLVAGGRLLCKLARHNKTVTSLSFSNGRSRLVTASLDSHVKFHDVSTFRTVHQIKLPSPILTAGVAPDDSFIVAGMSDGLVQFLHRRETRADEEERRRAELMAKPRFGYLRYTEFTPRPGDLVVPQASAQKEAKHDAHLRKFEHSRALDVVLRPYVQKKTPETTYSVLLELKRRGALRVAVAGRTEKELLPLINFVGRNISDARYAELLVGVAEEILDVYGDELGQQPAVDRAFVELRKRVDREAKNLRQMMQLRGAVDLVLGAARAHEPPRLRSEEETIRREMGAARKGDATQPGTTALEKILAM